MNKKLPKGFILGSAALAVVIPGGLIYSQYRRDMSLTYQRISSGGQMNDFVFWSTGCPPLTSWASS